jgi:two-component system, NtrC family, response regulator AtoC
MQEITKDALSCVEGTERLVEGEESASILHGSGWLASTFLPKGSTGGDVAGPADRHRNLRRRYVSIRRSRVWVVDDDPSVRSHLADLLLERGYDVQCLDSGEQVLHSLTNSPLPALLLLEIRLPRVSGLEILSALNKIGSRVPSIVLSRANDIPTVVEAMRLGASDYLPKPIEAKDLEAAIRRILGGNRPGFPVSPFAPEAAFESSNRRMLQIRAMCDQIARADVPILILGESGVGKEVLARYIHERSGRSEAFVKVNCAALPGDLLESELFGHERGAFTGALREKPGKFELASRGTLMLDEIAEMSPLLQSKLLHVLQDGEYSRLGGTATLTSGARIIAATNKCLRSLVSSGGFREDLYFRLNVITVEIPPLRERSEDIAPLCDHFVERYRTKYSSRVKQLPPELVAAFRDYRWPGNIRQLENSVKRFLLLPDLQQALAELESRTVDAAVAPEVVPPSNLSLKQHAASAAEQAEKELIFRTLNEVNWNRKKAAQRLNICYKSLLNKLHRWQAEAEQSSASKESRRSLTFTAGNAR